MSSERPRPNPPRLDVDEPVVLQTGFAETSGRLEMPPRPTALFVVAHGAGAGMEHPFLTGFAGGLHERGVGSLRFNFPYLDAGRKAPDPAPRLLAAVRAAVESARIRGGGIPLWVAGKSLGGRMASMAVADGLLVDGLVFLGYPLHAPGRQDRPRDAHLDSVKVPMLFLQGSADPFANLDLMKGVTGRLGKGARFEVIEGGDHSFRVRADGVSPAERGRELSDRAVRFLVEHLPGR